MSVKAIKTHKWVQYVALFSGVPWTIVLITFLAYWKSQGSPVYPWMIPSDSETATDADAWKHYVHMNPVYISDVAATKLQPLFITGCLLTALMYLPCLTFEAVMRFKTTYANAKVKWLRYLNLGVLLFAFGGQIGIFLVSVFNTRLHPHLHQIFLTVFILGIVGQLICQIVQHGVLTHNYPKLFAHETKRFTMKNPFWVSLISRIAFTIVAAVLVIMFKVVNFESYGMNARFEWTLSFFYNFLFPITWYDLRHLNCHIEEFNSVLRFKLEAQDEKKEIREMAEIDTTVPSAGESTSDEKEAEEAGNSMA
ncbi:hypothetical protein WICPIJ_001486 [Wickerhamomyces pijperi]|uniref:CWH43-like N-terminal domain-containing protein n=1 Tax=Wickerhamomyces pijperi TaxID=599730 RepID=A0A9P8QDH9_WICPI|nr:hypothetical protein WICPIJ_001486 [Wickerhamomyces pijperi]